jgi:DNA repair protein RadD
MVGRGLRLAEGKTECLVLDFGGNTRRHGAIDDPEFGIGSVRESSGEAGEAPTKECPACQAVVASGTRYCECGFRFEFESSVDKKADGLAQIMQAGNEPKWYEVVDVDYFIHTPKDEDKEQSMRVQYTVEPLDEESRDGNLSTRRFNEWICLAHAGFPRQKAVRWWISREAGISRQSLSLRQSSWRKKVAFVFLPKSKSSRMGSTTGLPTTSSPKSLSSFILRKMIALSDN